MFNFSEVFGFTNVALENWVASKAYNYGDLAIQNKQIWRCIHANTDGTFTVGNWEEISPALAGGGVDAVLSETSTNPVRNVVVAGKFRQPIYFWIANRNYKTDDLIIYNNNIYKSNSNHNSGGAFNAGDWTEISATPTVTIDAALNASSTNAVQNQAIANKFKQPIGNWTALAAYAVDDLVLYEDMIFQCVSANTDASFIGSKWTTLTTAKTDENDDYITANSAGKKVIKGVEFWMGKLAEYIGISTKKDGTIYFLDND